MLLSDRDILDAIFDGDVGIHPFDTAALQPASVDLRLHGIYRVPKHMVFHIDVADVPKDYTELAYAKFGEPIAISPGRFILASTEEVVRCGSRHAARIEGKSSLARLGLAVHVTGGFIDPGFDGQVTLEIVNLAPWTITLRAGMRIAQVAFFQLRREPDQLYTKTGRYNNQHGPTESKYTLDIEAA